MKTNSTALRPILYVVVIGCLALNFASTVRADPQLTSWFTNYSGQYAHIYTNDASKLSGASVTTWNNGTENQSSPAYSGIQEIDSSTSWVYVRSTGLGFHIMGPWYLDAAHTSIFPNWPINTKTFYRIPRTPAVPTTKTLNGGGSIGYFVDGVAMFNSWDAFYWSGSADTGGGASGGYWNRDAYVNEGLSFDPAYAHQPQDGTYHYHAQPVALRYLLGDHVTFNSTTKAYSESTAAATKHSPILAWLSDGYPLYGPYGYSNATNSSTGIRRMISGYVLRNGQNGTDNISTTGSARTYLPAWAIREYASTSPSGTTNGPAVSTSYPFSRYMEDNAYLGDLTNSATSQKYQQGTDFDLDEYNGRFCMTPEFPSGTYAYFVSISSNGTPVFPYNIGRAFRGSPTGGAVTTLTETVTTNFLGGPNAPLQLAKPTRSNNLVTLAWSAAEGGTYAVQSTTNFSTWTTNATNLAPIGSSGTYSGTNTASKSFFRVARTALAAYDPVTSTNSTSSGGILSVSPTSGSRGTTFTLTINLDPSANPAPPPQAAPINSITVGTITGASNVHVSTNQLTSSITIPAGATTGAQTVTVVFPGPPATPTQTVTYTLTGGFTIN